MSSGSSTSDLGAAPDFFSSGGSNLGIFLVWLRYVALGSIGRKLKVLIITQGKMKEEGTEKQTMRGGRKWLIYSDHDGMVPRNCGFLRRDTNVTTREKSLRPPVAS